MYSQTLNTIWVKFIGLHNLFLRHSMNAIHHHLKLQCYSHSNSPCSIVISYTYLSNITRLGMPWLQDNNLNVMITSIISTPPHPTPSPQDMVTSKWNIELERKFSVRYEMVWYKIKFQSFWMDVSKWKEAKRHSMLKKILFSVFTLFEWRRKDTFYRK